MGIDVGIVLFTMLSYIYKRHKTIYINNKHQYRSPIDNKNEISGKLILSTICCVLTICLRTHIYKIITILKKITITFISIKRKINTTTHNGMINKIKMLVIA